MAGLAMISLYDPKAGALELERCTKMGLRGAMIWCSPPSDQPYSSDVYDPFWARAQELRAPISLHSITGMGWESQWSFSDRYMRATVLSHDIERSYSVLIFSGVLDRFPDLRIVSAENNCGWLPYYLQRMDRTFERGRYAAGFKLSLKPSEYFRRNWMSAFMIDHYAVRNRHLLGVDNLMWSTDYPHHGCDWPQTRKTVDEMFRGVPDDERAKMTAGNAKRLYGLA